MVHTVMASLRGNENGGFPIVSSGILCSYPLLIESIVLIVFNNLIRLCPAKAIRMERFEYFKSSANRHPTRMNRILRSMILNIHFEGMSTCFWTLKSFLAWKNYRSRTINNSIIKLQILIRRISRISKTRSQFAAHGLSAHWLPITTSMLTTS